MPDRRSFPNPVDRYVEANPPPPGIDIHGPPREVGRHCFSAPDVGYQPFSGLDHKNLGGYTNTYAEPDRLECWSWILLGREDLREMWTLGSAWANCAFPPSQAANRVDLFVEFDRMEFTKFWLKFTKPIGPTLNIEIRMGSYIELHADVGGQWVLIGTSPKEFASYNPPGYTRFDRIKDKEVNLYDGSPPDISWSDYFWIPQEYQDRPLLGVVGIQTRTTWKWNDGPRPNPFDIAIIQANIGLSARLKRVDVTTHLVV